MTLLTIRALCFGLIFACNALMWILFTKALNAAPSSVQATTVNGAVNFSVSVNRVLLKSKAKADGRVLGALGTFNFR